MRRLKKVGKAAKRNRGRTSTLVALIVLGAGAFLFLRGKSNDSDPKDMLGKPAQNDED